MEGKIFLLKRKKNFTTRSNLSQHRQAQRQHRKFEQHTKAARGENEARLKLKLISIYLSASRPSLFFAFKSFPYQFFFGRENLIQKKKLSVFPLRSAFPLKFE